MNPPFGIALVGLGPGAQPHLRSLHDLRDGVVLRHAVTRRPAMADLGPFQGQLAVHDDLDAALKRSWKNKRRTCGIEHGSKPGEIQGQALYSDCMDFTIYLQAMQPPDHFIPGCFHRLADDLSIGWHPDYEQQLKVKKAA